MFGWFKKRSQRLEPEARWEVSIDATCITVRDASGEVKMADRAELSGILIETNDSGPWGADVWWLFFGANDHIACAYPQGATGEAAVLDALMALEGFDHTQMTAAMGSTRNAIFPVWRRSN
jgi:hypothetical protein